MGRYIGPVFDEEAVIDRFQAMNVFVQVAEAGGFAGAGRALNMSPPNVTRIIASLEAMLGTRLFVRTTRSVKLTEIGEVYLQDCRRLLEDVAQAEAAAAGSYLAPVGTLTVSAPVLFGRIYVVPLLSAFLQSHPRVVGRTLFVDRITNLVEEGIDVAVRIGHLPDASYAATRVGAVRRITCASPDHLGRCGTPRHPAELTLHRVIGTTAAWSTREWRFGEASDIVVRIEPALSCNTNDAAIAAAIAGFGLVRVPAYQVAEELRTGALEPVLEAFEEPPLPIHIVYAERQHAPAKNRLFIDLAIERLRADPAINDRV